MVATAKRKSAIRETFRVAANGASQLQDIFGKGKNLSRLIFGVARLPLGVPVEPEIIFEAVK